MADGTDYGWDQSGSALPHNSGIVRIQVTIFPTTIPLRKRVRQHYSYQFNAFTVSQIPSNQLENLETVTDEKSGAIGITFKKLDNIEHTVCGIPFINEIFGVSEEPGSQNYTNNKPSKPPTYYDRVGGKYYVDDIGESLYGSQLTVKEHQTFVAAGSLFSPGFMTREEIYFLLANEKDPSRYSEKLKFYLSITPEQSTIRLAETFTVSTKNYKESIKPAKAEIADSSYIGPNPNGASFFEGANSNVNNDGDFLKDLSYIATGKRADFNIQQFVGYVGVNNVYLGNFYTQMRNAGISPRPIVRGGIDFYGTFSDAKVTTHANLPPGIHISFLKALPIFPGEDFTIKFRKLSTDHPIASIEDGESGPIRWQMRNSYRFIDTGSFHTDSSSNGTRASNDNGVITANFGLCPPAYEGKDGKFNPERRIPKVAKDYYLANKPYVIVEIDGGIENRYFLIIPQEGNVVLVEVTSDFEIVDFVDEDGKFAKYLDGSRMPHSRVVHNFNISGGALLAMDAFSIHFQHFRGMLKIVFDPMQKSEVVSRKRYGVNIPDTLVPFPKKGLFVNDPKIKDKLNPEIIPIKLAGSVAVHIGHAKMAFNFTPIVYPASSTINLSYPVGITNLEGKESAINILLRDSGGFSEDEKGKKKITKTNSALIKDEFGKAVPGQSAPHYSHQANIMYETLGGSLTPVSYDNFSLNQKLCITGPSGSDDPAWGQQYGGVGKPSSIYASYRLTDAKEYVNRIYPYITIESGDMSLSGNSGSYTLKGATRPICSGFSVFVPEGKKAGWTGIGADVTNNVMEFSDTWDRSDRSFLSHTGNLRFYLNKSDALPILENITAVQTEKGKVTGGVRKAERINSGFLASFGDNTGDQTSLLASLQDKYFYVEVRAWRDPYKTRSHQVGASGDRGNTGPANVTSAFYATYKNNIPDSENTLMFTGLCRKSSYSISESHVEMSCSLEDYWSILDNMTWLNPPFYDAMRDYDAVFDVMAKAGFFYERSNRDPGYLINKLVSTPSDSDYSEVPYDGSKVLANDYVLPGSYNTMNQPILRPTGGSDKYSAILKKFAEISGKVIYFDRRGVMHFDIPPDEMEIMQMTGRSNGRPMYEAPIYDIFSHTYSSPMGQTIPWWNIVTGSYVFERAVNDIVNEIRIMSSTPEGSLVSAAHMNRASLSDIDLPGFIGFRRTFLQKSGYFGSGAAVKKQLERYTTMFNAPIIAKFSILGRVGMQAGETILMDGPGYSGAYRLLITNVSNTIKPKENEWLASIAGRYFIPGEKVKFTGSTISLGAGTGG